MNGPARPLKAKRRPAGVDMLRLYFDDALFRSCVDFAVIGLFVYLFVAPLPVPSLWDTASPPSSQGTSAAQPQQPSTTDIAQAARPSSGSRAKNEPIGRQWFRLSAPELLPALNQGADALDKNEIPRARALLEPLEHSNDPNVYYMLAILRMSSRERDAPKQAFELHLKAANLGHPNAMHEVGQFFRLGTAGKVDLPAAVDWYERAAALGDPDGASQAGRAYVKGWARPVDHAKAQKYYEQAAAAGHAYGMHNYGALLLNGEGIAPDAVQGRAWIEKAANKGLPMGQYSLAILWRDGVGGPQDRGEFLGWMQKSADQGHLPALYDLGMYYLKPTDETPPDVQRAAGYLRQAAMKKDAGAAFAYAALYEHGSGVKASNVQAFIYYTIALQAGEAAAQERLDALRGRMTAGEIETAQNLVTAASNPTDNAILRPATP